MNTKSFLLSLLVLNSATLVNAQNPAIEWETSLGGTSFEQCASINTTSDGGFIATGNTSSYNGDVTASHPGFDYWIVKLDGTGNLEWEKTLGGKKEDNAKSIEQTTDSGYLIAGFSTSGNGDLSANHGANDYWIVKTDAQANIEWERSLGGTDNDYAYDAHQVADGGYIICGASSSHNGDVTLNHGFNDFWIVKLDTDGNIEWQKSYGGSNPDVAFSIQQTSDGGYVAAGYTSSNDGDVTGLHGSNDYWIIKINGVGDLQWQSCFGGSFSDQAFAIEQTTDGGCIAAGRSSSKDGNVTGHHGSTSTDDYWIIKLSATGNLQWQKSLGGKSNDQAFSVWQTTDGYVAAGSSVSIDGNVTGNHGGDDYWIVLLSKTGQLKGQLSLGGSFNDVATSIRQIPGEEFIVGGISYSSDGDVSGHHGLNNTPDYWIVRVKSFPGLSAQKNYNGEKSELSDELQKVSASGNQTFLISPNPSNGEIELFLSIPGSNNAMINIMVFDVSGRKVFDEEGEMKDGQIQATLLFKNDLADGIYLLNVETSIQSFTKQFVLQRK